MVGRGYTIRELKEIIDYIKEIDAYGEIKGRKMWMDFERSGRTTRTWQSLKEVFLKRILTDLHNPYYKLTTEEISSFRVGYSMIKKNFPKLNVAKSSPNKEYNKKPIKTDKTVMTNGVPQKTKKAEVPRSDSVETVILETNNCYETAEEIANVLMSDNEENVNTKIGVHSNSTKKLRDCITFAEPLTPQLQQILNDFDTDESETNGNQNSEKEILNIKNNDSKITVNNNSVIPNKRKETPKRKGPEPKKNTISKKKLSNDNDKVNSKTSNETSKTKANKDSKSPSVLVNQNTDDNIVSTDSVIPNNQEALVNVSKSSLSQESIQTMNKRKPLKKRLLEGSVENSDDKPSERKKTKLNTTEEPITTVSTLSNSRNVDETSPNQNLGENKFGINRKATFEIKSKSYLQIPSLYSIVDNVVPTNDNKINSSDRVVLLGSSSENDSNDTEMTESKTETTDYLHKLFENTNDGRTTNARPKTTNYRANSKIRDSSSEWTSDSDSDFIDPPRCERRRSTRKYMKPGSARIMALENDGGLLITNNNKVYPIIVDGGGMRSFLKYKPRNEEVVNDELFWKKKYVEEKKRSADLAKILEGETANKRRKCSDTSVDEPRLKINDIETNKEVCAAGSAVTVPNTTKDDQKEDKSVKFKFVKDGQEMSIEGTWQNVQPILTDVMSMFQNNTKTIQENTKSTENISNKQATTRSKPIQNNSVNEQNVSKTPEESTKSIENVPNVSKTEVKRIEKDTVPVDNISSASSAENISSTLEARRRVEDIENKIFKEIKELDKQELDKQREENFSKITNRRARPRTMDNIKKDVVKEKETKTKLVNESPRTKYMNMRSHSDVETPKKTKPIPMNRHKSTEKISPVIEEIDDDVRYRFPSPVPDQLDNAGNKNPPKLPENAVKPSRTLRRKQYYMKNLRKQTMSLDALVSDFSDSMQGYRDSDTSFVNIKRQRRTLATRRRHSSSSVYRRSKAGIQRLKMKQPKLCMDSSSSNDMPVPQYLNSKDYRTDSYDLLMQQRSSPLSLKNTLENIEENDNSKSDEEISQHLNVNLSPATQNIDANDSFLENKSTNCLSNVTLKIENSRDSSSPEISIVECITVSQEIIDVNMSNEESQDDTSSCTGELLRNISKILNHGKKDYSPDRNVAQTVKSKRNVSEMSVDEQIHAPKVGNSKNSGRPQINIEEPNISGTLNEKLSKLILDSAKKIENSETVLNCGNNALNKRSKKRSSTPNKRNSKMKVDTIIEEHMEFCAVSRGRNSCPPSFGNLLVPSDSPDHEYETTPETNMNKEDQTITKDNKKKREIIKVKILRPRRKEEKKSLLNVESKECNSDKSDPESGIFVHGLNESVDLIHNHSESCLHATECVIDSGLPLDLNRTKECASLIPAECTMATGNAFDISVECFSSDAQDISLFSKTTKTSSQTESSSPLDSPTNVRTSSLNSLMTEDLSDETPQTKSDWFLLSEDELTNSPITKPEDSATPKPSSKISQYMNKLFPVACTVPNLSTITEGSRDTDENSTTIKQEQKESQI